MKPHSWQTKLLVKTVVCLIRHQNIPHAVTVILLSTNNANNSFFLFSRQIGMWNYGFTPKLVKRLLVCESTNHKMRNCLNDISSYLKMLGNRKLVFGLIAIALSLSLVSYSYAQEPEIPSWIKTIAGFWANDQITDLEFLGALQYLIDHELLLTSSSSKPTDAELAKEAQEIPINEETNVEKSFSSVDLMTFKVQQLQEIVSHPDIVKAIQNSNAEFSQMDDPTQFITEKDEQWKSQPKNQNSPFMNSLIENRVANILKTKSVIPTEEFGDVLFPEIIVTNAYGANVAITSRTDDYNQGDEVWWFKARNLDVQFRPQEWDESARIFSSDIIIKIVDEQGYFIGVLNAATPER